MRRQTIRQAVIQHVRQVECNPILFWPELSKLTGAAISRTLPRRRLSDKQTGHMETPETFQPLDRRKVYEQVAEQLLGRIGSGRLVPGDPLPSERELTESFGVGRSSIREALRMLESQGVITGANGGAFVVADASNPLNSSLQLVFALDGETGVHDLFELRRIIDCEAAALAAIRRSDEHVAEMQRAVAEMEAALAAEGRAERFIAADLRFHLAIAEATGNRLILYSMQAAREVVRTALLTVVHVPQSPERAVVEHRAICEAIASGNPRGARDAMCTHLDRVERDAEKEVVNG
jgi:GntR family transcriptional regulator, transcriptional repressor for pyruvate dehydrogenase complex